MSLSVVVNGQDLRTAGRLGRRRRGSRRGGRDRLGRRGRRRRRGDVFVVLVVRERDERRRLAAVLARRGGRRAAAAGRDGFEVLDFLLLLLDRRPLHLLLPLVVDDDGEELSFYVQLDLKKKK
jgi:hypothetical protein